MQGQLQLPTKTLCQKQNSFSPLILISSLALKLVMTVLWKCFVKPRQCWRNWHCQGTDKASLTSRVVCTLSSRCGWSPVRGWTYSSGPATWRHCTRPVNGGERCPPRATPPTSWLPWPCPPTTPRSTGLAGGWRYCASSTTDLGRPLWGPLLVRWRSICSTKFSGFNKSE